MICDKYKELDGFQQPLFCAKVLHCLMNDENLFSIGEEIIKLGILKGLFDGVKIGAAEIANTPPTQTITASDTYSTTQTEK